MPDSAKNTNAAKINTPRGDRWGLFGNWITEKSTRECWIENEFRGAVRKVSLILASSFGHADVAAERNQPNRRDRCRQSKDQPHRCGMPRPMFRTKRG